MDENKNILDLDECEDTDDCMKLSLDDDIGDDFEELWDAADEEDFEECAPCKSNAKKKRLILIAVACVAAAVTAFIIYKLVKNSKKSD